VVERGTHRELMEARGAYHDMVLRQMESDARDAHQHQLGVGVEA
jgi:hypothetical protein